MHYANYFLSEPPENSIYEMGGLHLQSGSSTITTQPRDFFYVFLSSSVLFETIKTAIEKPRKQILFHSIGSFFELEISNTSPGVISISSERETVHFPQNQLIPSLHSSLRSLITETNIDKNMLAQYWKNDFLCAVYNP